LPDNITQEQVDRFLLTDVAKSIQSNPSLTEIQKSRLLKQNFFNFATRYNF